MFSMTMSAATEILAAAARSDAAGMALRVAARQIADGSLEYGLGFDDEREDDQKLNIGELTVLVGSPSVPLLADTVLDYVEVAPSRFDFVFMPPPSDLAAGAGCGSGAARSGGGGGGCGSGSGSGSGSGGCSTGGCGSRGG
jgi:iron-sulfur cluster assembly protein